MTSFKDRTKIDQNKINKLIHSIALKYNMSDDDMKNLLHSPYEFTKEKVKELKLNEITTKEELDNTKTNFIYRSFFKIIVEWKTINGKLKMKDNINKENYKKWKK
jgi:hypothetical protein